MVSYKSIFSAYSDTDASLQLIVNTDG